MGSSSISGGWLLSSNCIGLCDCILCFVWNSRLVFLVVCTACLVGSLRIFGGGLFLGTERDIGCGFLERAWSHSFGDFNGCLDYRGGGDLLIVMIVVGGLSCRRW
jgi:hypothetical protein